MVSCTFTEVFLLISSIEENPRNKKSWENPIKHYYKIIGLINYKTGIKKLFIIREH